MPSCQPSGDFSSEPERLPPLWAFLWETRGAHPSGSSDLSEGSVTSRAVGCGGGGHGILKKAVKGSHLWSTCYIPTHEEREFREVKGVAQGHPATNKET